MLTDIFEEYSPAQMAGIGGLVSDLVYQFIEVSVCDQLIQ